MGCDIHVHIEIKVSGQWHHYNQPYLNRNYNLFAKIAGVRGDGTEEAIAPDRGIPEDATFTTLFEYNHRKDDYYSMTWLSLEEIAELEEWYKIHVRGGISFNHDGINYLCGSSFSFFLKHREEYPPELEDARMVCWFDG